MNEFPKHPLPHGPEPQLPERPQVQPSTVIVYERQRWEYKVVLKRIADEQSLSEDELNVLGASGWELVGVIPLAGELRFFFKRVRA